MDLFHLTIIFAAGAIAGLMNSIAGGGTIVTFPALILAGIPSIPANATSTVALLPSALGYTYGYRKNIPAVWNWIKLFAIVSLAGGFLGGILLVRTPPAVFDWLVPFLILLATGLFTANNFFQKFIHFEPHEPLEPHEPRPAAADGAGVPGRTHAATSRMDKRHWRIGLLVFQFFISVYGGSFGAGIGILMLATLGMMGMANIHEMNTVKGILGFLINIVVAVYFAATGLVNWPDAIVIAAGSMIGGYSGAALAQRIPQKAVRWLITGIGAALTLIMFVKQVRAGKL